ncbi:MAG: hypothetical protein K5873_08460 [Treponema sp.]|nr:hypothetical protein [Treponema sp.]
MKKSFYFILFFAIIPLVSCSNNDDNDSSSTPRKTVYKATASFSDYTQKTLAKLDYSDFPESSITNEDLVPDVFAARATDPNETWYLSDDKVNLAIRTCLAGKTVLLGAPSLTGVIAFAGKVTEVLQKEGNEALQAQSSLSRISLYNMLNQYFNKELENKSESGWYSQKDYDAVAFRDGEIYFVHKIDEVYDETAFSITSSTTKETKTDNQVSHDSVLGSQDTVHSEENTTTDYSALETDSIQKLVNWISGKEDPNSPSTDSRSLFDKYPEARALTSIENDEARKAQRFVHNFVAKSDKYGRKENVEVLIDVWAYCQIDQQTDWYYVRTAVTCNNDQLDFRNWWDDDKTTSAYLGDCSIENSIWASKQTVRTQDCRPQNEVGSSTHSTGFNVQLGGNIGMGGSGPTGGFSGNLTWTKSTSMTIPNISISFNNKNNNPYWLFNGQHPKGRWSGFVTRCDNPPEIQTSKAVTFETLSVYTLPSDHYEGHTDTVGLTSYIQVALERIVGWKEGFMNLDIQTKHIQCSTKPRYDDYIRKPCNAKGDYIMYFDAPEGSTPERIDLFTRELKEVIPAWDGSKTAIYAVGAKNVDKVATDYFTTIKDKITKNKIVLKSKGFSGDFKFYIKNSDSESAASSFSITF